MTSAAGARLAGRRRDGADGPAEEADGAAAERRQLLRRLRSAERRVAMLEEANDELLGLTSEVAHDLATPLQVVVGFSELLEGRPCVRSDATAREFVAAITQTAAGMRRTLAGMAGYARAAATRYRMGTVDCAALVQHTLAVLDGTVARVGATVHVGVLPQVPGDRVQLACVFQNLIANALAHGRDGVPLSIAIDARRAPGGCWVLSVTDNGEGIGKGQHDAVFRVRHPAARLGDELPGDGLGVGLAICKRIVERHGGRIWVEDQPSGGARFCVRLPDG